MDRCSIAISIHKKSFFQRRGGQKDTIMGWKPIHFGLAGMMLIFGSFNTLSVKWADTMKRWVKILLWPVKFTSLSSASQWMAPWSTSTTPSYRSYFNSIFLGGSSILCTVGLRNVSWWDALYGRLLGLRLLEAKENRGEPICRYWRRRSSKTLQSPGLPAPSLVWHDCDFSPIYRPDSHICLVIPGMMQSLSTSIINPIFSDVAWCCDHLHRHPLHHLPARTARLV